MPYVGNAPTAFTVPVTQISSLDDINSQFNGSTTTFNITINGLSYPHATSRSLLIVLGGIIQKPNEDYTVSGDQITFSTAPASGLSFEGRHLYGIPVTYEETLQSKILIKTKNAPFGYLILAKDTSIVTRSATYNYVDLDKVTLKGGGESPLQITSTLS